MRWHTQAINITTNLKVKVDFTLPALSVMNVGMCRCHVDNSAKGRYNMILVRDVLTKLRLNLKLYQHFIESDDGPFNGSTAHMVDLGTYIFKYLNLGKITPEESFTNSYVEEVYETDVSS